MNIVLRAALIWVVLSVVITSLWIAAHGGIRSDR